VLYEKIGSKSGKRYFVGGLADARLVMFRGPDTDQGEPTWRLIVEERDAARRPGAQQGQQVQQRPRPQNGAPAPRAQDDLDDPLPF
jgi:hypothetical protein